LHGCLDVVPQLLPRCVPPHYGLPLRWIALPFTGLVRYRFSLPARCVAAIYRYGLRTRTLHCPNVLPRYLPAVAFYAALAFSRIYGCFYVLRWFLRRYITDLTLLHNSAARYAVDFTCPLLCTPPYIVGLAFSFSRSTHPCIPAALIISLDAYGLRLPFYGTVATVFVAVRATPDYSGLQLLITGSLVCQCCCCCPLRTGLRCSLWFICAFSSLRTWLPRLPFRLPFRPAPACLHVTTALFSSRHAPDTIHAPLLPVD